MSPELRLTKSSGLVIVNIDPPVISNTQYPISGYSVQNSWESFMCVPTSKKDTSVKDSEVGEVGGGGDGEDVEHQLGGQGNGHLFDQR